MTAYRLTPKQGQLLPFAKPDGWQQSDPIMFLDFVHADTWISGTKLLIQWRKLPDKLDDVL